MYSAVEAVPLRLQIKKPTNWWGSAKRKASHPEVISGNITCHRLLQNASGQYNQE